MAFTVWNIGTRGPVRLFRDVATSRRSLNLVVRGLWRFVVGSAMIVAGSFLLLAMVNADIRREFGVLETIAILAGLALEMLLGPELRRARGEAG